MWHFTNPRLGRKQEDRGWGGAGLVGHLGLLGSRGGSLGGGSCSSGLGSLGLLHLHGMERVRDPMSVILIRCFIRASTQCLQSRCSTCWPTDCASGGMSPGIFSSTRGAQHRECSGALLAVRSSCLWLPLQAHLGLGGLGLLLASSLRLLHGQGQCQDSLSLTGKSI